MLKSSKKATIILLISIVLIFAFIGVIIFNTRDMTFEQFFDGIKKSFYLTFVEGENWRQVGKALLITIQISILSVVLGSISGLYFAHLLRHKNKFIARVCNFINYIIDGYPVLIIIMLLQKLVFNPQSQIDIILVCIVGIALDFANNFAVMFNIGINAVEKGEIETALSMGYNDFQTFWKVVFPQATEMMFNQYSGMVVSLVKGTSVVGYLGVVDLTLLSEQLGGLTNDSFPLIVSTILYFIVAKLLVFVLERVSKKINPEFRKRRIRGVKIHNDED